MWLVWHEGSLKIKKRGFRILVCLQSNISKSYYFRWIDGNLPYLFSLLPFSPPLIPSSFALSVQRAGGVSRHLEPGLVCLESLYLPGFSPFPPTRMFFPVPSDTELLDHPLWELEPGLPATLGDETTRRKKRAAPLYWRFLRCVSERTNG